MREKNKIIEELNENVVSGLIERSKVREESVDQQRQYSG